MKPSGKEKDKRSANRTASDLAHHLPQKDLQQIRSELNRLRLHLNNLESILQQARVASFNQRVALTPVGHAQKKNRFGLSTREQEVMRFVSQGLTDRQVGQKMFVSVNTVKTHLRRIFTKMNAGTRTEAVLRYRG